MLCLPSADLSYQTEKADAAAAAVLIGLILSKQKLRGGKEVITQDS